MTKKYRKKKKNLIKNSFLLISMRVNLKKIKKKKTKNRKNFPWNFFFLSKFWVSMHTTMMQLMHKKPHKEKTLKVFFIIKFCLQLWWINRVLKNEKLFLLAGSFWFSWGKVLYHSLQQKNQGLNFMIHKYWNLRKKLTKYFYWYAWYVSYIQIKDF